MKKIKKNKKYWKNKFEHKQSELKSLVIDYNYALEDNDRLAALSSKWRAEYEALMSSPEIKADTEAAFQRGQYIAKQQMAAYFIEALTVMKFVPEMEVQP